MKKQKIDSPITDELAAEVREGDGVDPREEAKRKQRRSGNVPPGDDLYHQQRLASQVRTAVDFALQSAKAPILNALTVHNVVPQKGVLVVVIVPRDPTVPVDPSASAVAVRRASAMLRCEVAAAITRKETPTLRFIVLPGGSEEVHVENFG